MDEIEDQDGAENTTTANDREDGEDPAESEETAALEKLLSEKVCDPAVAAGMVIGSIDGNAVAKYVIPYLEECNERLAQGDYSQIEEMLLDQSHALQAIFTKQARLMDSSETLNQFEAHGRLALKAQNQCRQTLATLLEARKPRSSTFIGQQNNAVNQQINDGDPGRNSENFENSTNEQLQDSSEQRLEPIPTRETIPANP